MIRRLIILLLIVGCGTIEPEYSILGKWIVTESTNIVGSENSDGCNNFFVDTYFDITVDSFIMISEQIGMDENANPTTNWFFGKYFYYLDNSPNLTISIDSSFNSTNLHFTYEVNETELNLQFLSRINNGDTTACNSNIIATSVSVVPDNCHLLDNSCID